jgi:hypothetical protein
MRQSRVTEDIDAEPAIREHLVRPDRPRYNDPRDARGLIVRFDG